MAAWSTAEWASVVSAASAAGAAIVSALATGLGRLERRASQRPNVTAGYNVTPDRKGLLIFANAGPGLGVQLQYLGVDPGDDGESSRKYGGTVGNGFLQPGATQEIPLKPPVNATGPAHFVWFCRDIRNDVHVWSYAGGYRRIPASHYLNRRAPQTLGGYFALMYPEMEVPWTVEAEAARRRRRFHRQP